MIAAARIAAILSLAAALSSPAIALEKSVRYYSPPLMSEQRAGEICKTFKPAQDRRARIVRFVCTRKLLYVCNREIAVPSADPEAAGKCFVERARNYD